MDVAVRQYLAIETGVLEDEEGSGEAIRRVGDPGCEQVPAVGSHRKVGVMGAFLYQPEERQHAGPRAEARGKGAAPGGSTFKLFQQAVQSVALVIEGVVAGQQLARLREQDHHEPHRHPTGGAVDVLRGRARGCLVIAEWYLGRRDPRDVLQVCAVLGDVRLLRSLGQGGQRFAVTADEDLDRFAHPLAEHLGEIRLSLAGVADRLQQRRRGVFALGCPEDGTQQGAERRHLRGKRAFLEPQVEVPLAPGVVVEPGEQQPPLPAVRHQGEMITAGPQPAEHLAHDSAASADAQAPAVVHEHRQSPAVPARPQMARLHRLAGDGAPPPGRRDVDAAGPVTGRGAETADLLQHEGDEGRYGATVPTRLRHCARTLA